MSMKRQIRYKYSKVCAVIEKKRVVPDSFIFPFYSLLLFV